MFGVVGSARPKSTRNTSKPDLMIAEGGTDGAGSKSPECGAAGGLYDRRMDSGPCFRRLRWVPEERWFLFGPGPPAESGCLRLRRLRLEGRPGGPGGPGEVQPPSRHAAGRAV